MCSGPSLDLSSSFWGKLRSVITAVLGRGAAMFTPTQTTPLSSAASAEDKPEDTFKWQLTGILSEVLREPQFAHLIVDPKTGATIAVMLSIDLFQEFTEGRQIVNYDTQKDIEL